MTDKKQLDPLYTLGLIMGVTGALVSLLTLAWPLLGPLLIACVVAGVAGSGLNASLSSAFSSVVESTGKLNQECQSSVPTQFGTSAPNTSMLLDPYPGSRLVSQTKEGDTNVLKFQTPTPETMVGDFFRSHLLDKGFVLEAPTDPNRVTGTRNGDSLTVTISSPFAGTTEYEMRSIGKPR